MTRLNDRFEAIVWSNRWKRALEICGKEITRLASSIWSMLTWKSRVIYDRRRLGYVKRCRKGTLRYGHARLTLTAATVTAGSGPRPRPIDIYLGSSNLAT
ncbi:hypothetical protein RSAG8_00942, partial [Rhizoctonia solani AG-8 WAC10335]